MTYRVAILEFAQECNTFTIRKTDVQAFRDSRLLIDADMITKLGGTNSEIGGAIEFAQQHGWTPVPIIAAHANPGGPVTEPARQEITAMAIDRLAASGPFDGVFVALHGAMVTETDQDGESQFLRALRDVVGDDIPVAVTLDLHANIFDTMAELVNIAVSYRTYPHVDMADRAFDACALLHHAMAGKISPALHIDRPAMLVGCDDGRTTSDGPMCRILERACDAEQSAGILHVAVNAGFTDADVFAAGPSVLVTHDAGARKVAQDVARDLCDLIWSYRDDWARPMPLSDCIDHLKSTPTGDKPIVVADFSDNPGSGAYGDCTALLRELLRAGLRNAALGAVCDPEAAQGLTAAGEGATVALPIGGKTDPNVGGGPLTLTGIVTCVSDGALRFEGPMLAGVAADLGPSVCFQVEGIDIVIASNPMQVHDLNVFRCLGIEPAQKALVVVKSMQHFRAAFDPIAQEVLVVDAGGLSSPNVALRRYDRLRRPVFPLDQFDDPA